jgi:general secretion pathway protein G
MTRNNGFTLIEAMLVIILISILAAIIIPRYSSGSKRAKVQSCEMDRSIMNTQVEIYYFTEGTWPIDSLVDIKTNKSYFPDGIPTCPVDLTSYKLAISPSHRITTHREGAGTHIF